MTKPATSPRTSFGSWVLPIWLLGVAILCGYRAASWLAAQRLRRRAVCVAVPEWQSRLDRLVQQLRVSRTVALLESSLTDTPLTMGVLRPVILLPIGLLAGLPVEQVELILLHELAHIRRHDYLINLLQTAIESLLFYHPGVWWLSRSIRMERECCCDDIVVAATNDVATYARTLTELEHRRVEFNHAVLAATGGNLMFRIKRLLGRPATPKAAASGPLAIALLLASCVALFGWQGTQPQPRPQSAVTQVQSGATTANPKPDATKIGPHLKANPFFKAIHEHLWSAVIWFHQLLGLPTPPKARAANGPEKPSAQAALAYTNWIPIRQVRGSIPFAQVKSGDTVVFRDPADTRQTVVKRVIDPNSPKMMQLASFARQYTRQERVFLQVGTYPSDPSRLTGAYLNWLTEEVPEIITNAEWDAFWRLDTDKERQAFTEQFWLRRDPTPDTPQNEFMDEHYRRLLFVDERYGYDKVPGHRSGRGKIYIRYGPPDTLEIQNKDNQNLVASEKWKYKHLDGTNGESTFVFLEMEPGDYRIEVNDGRAVSEMRFRAAMAEAARRGSIQNSEQQLKQLFR